MRRFLCGMRFGLLLILVCGGAAAAGEATELAFEVKKFVVQGDNPLPERVTEKTLAPFLGPQQGLGRLEAAAGALEAALVARGYAFHRAVVPPQKISDAAVVIRLVAFKLQAVTVDNNRHVSEDNVRRALPVLATGATLNTLDIARALQTANAHPARRLAVFVLKSAAPAAVDTRIEVTDRRPYRISAAINNTGDPETGRYRLSLGLQHANLLGRDHMLNLSYTTSPEYPDDVVQGGVYYRLPLYRLHTWLSAFYTRSEIDQGIVSDFFEVSGQGSFWGVLADHRLRPVGAYQHRVSLGLQDRLFENDTRFGSDDLGTDVRSRPLSLSYNGRWEKGWGALDGRLEGALNLDGGGDNDEAAYRANRTDADPDWALLRYGFDGDVHLARRWRLVARLSGQWTDEPLISGEQFGIGGRRSVRGYYEREVTGDRGQQLSLELRAPPQAGSVEPLAFFDVGRIRREEPHQGLDGEEILAGAGVGLRWAWRDHVSLTLDLANALDPAVETESGDWRLHVNLFLQF